MNIKRLQRNTGEQLTTIYGCSDLKLPKSEKVISRQDNSPDNSQPSIVGGWLCQKVTTNKRVIQVNYNYQNGDLEVEKK